jgi:hypothetical protein
MYFRITIKFFVKTIFLGLILTSDYGFAQIRYFEKPTLALSPDRVVSFLMASQDSIANDTLYQVLSKEGFPLSYYRKIRTSVCFDNKCRLLKCVIYWNITGRYLGFELPKGEFLSKAEHKEFTREEYLRLGTLLADQLSPLGNLSYAELAPNPKPTTNADDEVDGVSSATAKNVLEYVVEGAAYTTYKMWHVVYGPTQEDIVKLTEKSLTPDLVMILLQSPDLNDQIWVLNHIRGFVDITQELEAKLFSLISGSDYNLAERAIHAFDATAMKSERLQQRLFTRFEEGNYAIKKLIIARFKESSSLSAGVEKKLAESLKTLNGELVSNILDVFSKHQTTHDETLLIVAGLLQNENRFVSQKAFKYLQGLKVNNEAVNKLMNEYSSKK